MQVNAHAISQPTQKRCEDAPHSEGTSCEILEAAEFCFAKFCERAIEINRPYLSARLMRFRPSANISVFTPMPMRK